MQTIASEVMTMREEKPNSPSQKNKQTQKKNWFWPAMYSGIAIVFVGMIWGYSAFIKDDTPGLTDGAIGNKTEDGAPIVETNASEEVLKYPFAEELLDDVAILQNYYDVEADETTRESALLVFNQSFTTNTGVSISIDDKPFEVVASKSGVVEEIITDVFQGDEVVVSHADGMKTVYSSLTEVIVKKGDEVSQGQPLATTAANEWNPTAGVHLHFEVLVDDETVNPASYLGF